MIKMLAIGGMPGTGKTTLVRNLLNELRAPGDWSVSYYNLLRFERYNRYKLAVLGVYPDGETYGGTDRLSMAVHPDAEEVVRIAASQPNWDGSKILFEGDRLYGIGFLTECYRLLGADNMTIVELSCWPEELARRYKERESSQDAKWLKGRRTKIDNVANALPVRIVVNADKAGQEQNLEALRGWVNSGVLAGEAI